MNPARRRAIFRRLQQANPEPTTELEHSTPFELLTAVMLSAHTTDKSVNTATRKLFPVANTPEAIYKLGVEGVKPYLKSVGLYNAKAKNLIEMCRILIEKHAGQVPSTREALEELPGVGRKTASVILNMVFGELEIAVDTHIFRVANRTGLAPGKNPLAVEQALLASTPEEYRRHAHHWLLLHGRYICQARVPLCPKCLISDLCEYPNKTPPKLEPKAPRVGPQIRAVASKLESKPKPRVATQAHDAAAPRSTTARGAEKPATKKPVLEKIREAIKPRRRARPASAGRSLLPRR